MNDQSTTPRTKMELENASLKIATTALVAKIDGLKIELAEANDTLKFATITHALAYRSNERLKRDLADMKANSDHWNKMATDLANENARQREEIEKWSRMPPENLAMARQVGEKLYSVCCEATSIKKENDRMMKTIVAIGMSKITPSATTAKLYIEWCRDILSNAKVSDAKRSED